MTGDVEQPTGDVASFRFPNAVARSTDQTTKVTAFQAMGWNSVNSEPYENSRGWAYTATPASLGISASPVGETRLLVQEFYPFAMRGEDNPLDAQPDPYLEWHASSAAEGTLPANVYFRYWVMLVEEFDADIGSGTQAFTSTIQNRNKQIYPSRATDPPYPATFTDGLNWDLVPGSQGFEAINEHIAVPGAFPTDEIFLALDTAADDFGAGGADNQLVSDDLQHRLYQNINNTTGKIVKGVWTEVTLHFDTSSAYGVWRAWIKPEGQSRIQVAHWVDSRHADAVALGGGTDDFVWDIPVGQRVGHRTFRLNPVYGGNDVEYGDMMLVTSAIDIATSWANLPDYDA